MFIGHYAAALAAKKVDNKISLGTYILASQFIDLLWPIFILLGIEKVNVVPDGKPFNTLAFTSYPFSHSLLGVLFWGIVVGGVYYVIKKNMKGSIVLGLLVISHWILDFITHIPDLPLTPWGETKVGLGLWNSASATIAIESIIFAGGISLFLKTIRLQNTKGKIIFWSMITFLLVIYIASILSPPPLSAEPVAYSGLLLWLFVAWGYWINKTLVKN